MSRVLEVVDHDPAWAGCFEREARALSDALAGVVVGIEHIGSTAVAGLAAKPVIDILLEVTALDVLDRRRATLEALGYSVRGENGIDGRRYFTKGTTRRTHQVHAFAVGDRQLDRHRAFRDYLSAEPEVARDYAALKKSALRSSGGDPARYQALKSEFVREHARIALERHDAAV